MLVLSRREGQSIRIDGPCVVTLIEIDEFRAKVKLGFEAEKSVRILRTEIDEKGGRANE